MELSERAVYQYASHDQVAQAARKSSLATWYVAAGLVAAFVLLTWTIGYAFVIVCALTGTALALTTIVVFTAADLFTMKKGTAQHQANRH
ncbi:MAG: hypothetical protein ACLP8A_01695 [Methylovirgula sp.]